MIGALRHVVGRLMPAALKWRLLRALPRMVTWTAKVLQGIAPIWDSDAAFTRLFDSVADRCLMDKRRAHVLFNAARNVTSKPGAIAEMGVYRGASARILLEATSYEKDFYGFDTFEGLPATERARDPYWRQGEMAETSVEDVRRFLDRGRVNLIKGIFPESAKDIGQHVTFCLVHIDGDLYRTTRAALEFFHPRLIATGIIVVNDYGFISSTGVREAVDEFFAGKTETPIYLPSGQCLIIKQ